MRSVARCGLRLVGNNSNSSGSATGAIARSVCTPDRRLLTVSQQCPQSLQRQVRCLSHTTARRVEPRGSNEPPSHHNELERRAEDQKTREDQTSAPAARDVDTEGNESRTGTDDGRSLGGKTFRQRKKANANTLPPPPEIPSWFLDYNVKLHVDTLELDRSTTNGQVLRVVDGETGHTLFTLPFYEAWPVPGLIPETASPASESHGNSAEKRPASQGFFDSKVSPHLQGGTPLQKRHDTEIVRQPSGEAYAGINPHALLRWSVLQAEAGIRAAFALAGETPQSSTQSASKLDLSLVCFDTDSHESLDEIVEDLAAITEADLVRLDANDIADLATDYVGQGSDAPGAFANLAYDVFGGYISSPPTSRDKLVSAEDRTFDEERSEADEEDEEAEAPNTTGKESFFTLDSLRRTLVDRQQDFARAMSKFGAKDIIVDFEPRSSRAASSNMYRSGASQGYDIARLSALLESLLDAPRRKRLAESKSSNGAFHRRQTAYRAEGSQKKGLSEQDVANQALWRRWRSSSGLWNPDVAGLLAARIRELAGAGSHPNLNPRLESHNETIVPKSGPAKSGSRTIVHVRDLKDICNSRLGDQTVRCLAAVVRKLRRSGRQVVIVGSSCCEEMFGSQVPADFKNITIPAVFHMAEQDQAQFKPSSVANAGPSPPPYSRILEINLRHLGRMLKSLRPAETLELFSESAQRQLRLGGDILGQEVLPRETIQRLVLTAIGLSQVHAASNSINAAHIGLATLITQRAAQTQRDWAAFAAQKKIDAASKQRHGSSSASEKGPLKRDAIKKECNQHESRLLPGVVDAANIKTGFEQVHAPPETIESLRTLTSLALIRPEAFTYGILAADRLPGIMLYGPPGTGKTLLAKAVAKESGATVLEVSGAQIYEKYVGEGEKMVRAVFTLAKKLSPCIVFLDEADAIFGSRSSAGNRNTHREIINQFLREWDGMDTQNCIMMVASNRPFDLDDAVLRRLPRRLLVDLPVANDRESILKIHLKDEALDSSVQLGKLAEDTPLYSGSDLKNVCVAAALACVREENELQARKKDEQDFRLPEKRTLSLRHFEQALKEISASISEDMGSLSAIRKFDEQYGDRQGRRKKANYGFGLGEGGVNESAVRVRQSAPRP